MPSSLENLIRNIIIRKVELAIQGNVESLPPSIENEIKTPEFPEILKNWSEINAREVQALCDDAVTILQFCSRHENKKASKYVTELVTSFNEKLTKDFDIHNHPERFYWSEVSKSVIRLLAAYISLANFEDNAEVKSSICHKLIIKMTPPLNPQLPWTYKSSDTIISLTLPRIYSQFMFNEANLKKELKDDILVLVGEQYENLRGNKELRDNFEYYKFYDGLYKYYRAAIKDTQLLEYRKMYERDD